MHLHEERVQRILEGGDGTVGVGEGGLEMSEDMSGRAVPRCGGQRDRQLGRRAQRRQCGADPALAQVEALPDALPGSVTEMAVDCTAGREDTAGSGELEKPPQTGGGQAKPADFVGTPDAEGPAATRACVAVAAKDPPGAHGFASGAGVVKAAQIAMPNQCADHLAMRTRHQLEPQGQRVPFRGSAAKPALAVHWNHTSTKIVIVAAWPRGGVAAGYDKKTVRGVRGKIPGGPAQPRQAPFAKFAV